MSLPTKYDRRIRNILHLRAVWEPGAAIDLGDIVTRRRGVFVPIDSLKDNGIAFRTARAQESELNLTAQGVSETLIQGDATVPDVNQLQTRRNARLEIEFKRANTYHLRTPTLRAVSIDDLRRVGQRAARIDGWNFRRYYIVWKVLVAKEFSFLGSVHKNRKIVFSGSGAAIAKLLDTGFSSGVTKVSSRKLDVEINGTGGPVVMGVTRIRRDGRLRDV